MPLFPTKRERGHIASQCLWMYTIRGTCIFYDAYWCKAVIWRKTLFHSQHPLYHVKDYRGLEPILAAAVHKVWRPTPWTGRKGHHRADSTTKNTLYYQLASTDCGGEIRVLKGTGRTWTLHTERSQLRNIISILKYWPWFQDTFKVRYSLGKY